MISEKDIPSLLKNELPEIKDKLDHDGKSLGAGLYRNIQVLTDNTRMAIKTGNMQSARKCFRTAELLLSGGNTCVKSAVRNIFLYSLAYLLERRSQKGEELRKVLGRHLRNELHAMNYMSMP